MSKIKKFKVYVRDFDGVVYVMDVRAETRQEALVEVGMRIQRRATYLTSITRALCYELDKDGLMAIDDLGEAERIMFGGMPDSELDDEFPF